MADAGRLPLPIGDIREGVVLTGAINGANQTFTTTEKFIHTPPGVSIKVFYNGHRLLLGDDYIVSESGGSGTGFDTVTTVITPRTGDKIWADYVVVP